MGPPPSDAIHISMQFRKDMPMHPISIRLLCTIYWKIQVTHVHLDQETTNKALIRPVNAT